jgi:hypothetical protein
VFFVTDFVYFVVNQIPFSNLLFYLSVNTVFVPANNTTVLFAGHGFANADNATHRFDRLHQTGIGQRNADRVLSNQIE